MTAIVGVAAETLGNATIVKRRGWSKADIKRVCLDGTQAILKDFVGKSWAVRWLGRRQVLREIRALRLLRGIPGIPLCHGEAPPCGILLEPMEGERITRWSRRSRAETASMFGRLDRLVEQMHARGVVHLDLCKRDNILVGPSGLPSIIDFNASVCFRPGSLAARLLLPLLRHIDTFALLKWKSRLSPDLLTAAEWRSHQRMRLLRRVWIFN